MNKYMVQGVFTPPDAVFDLADIPGAFKEMFEPATQVPGQFVLTADGRKLRNWAVGEAAKIRAESERRAVENAATIARMTKQIADLSINSAIRSALASEGVAAHFLTAACALVKQSNSFEVDVDDADAAVLVQTDFGLYSVQDTVNAFLDSDEGKCFAPAKHVAAATGMFSTMISNMKR